jgi:cell division septum initiation protein DivIVA
MSEYQIWKMKKQPKLAVARKSAVHWFEQKYGRTPEFNERDSITVNYIRHAFTHYNDLTPADPDTFQQSTIEDIRRKVYTAIADKYPDLLTECDKQMVVKHGENIDGIPRILGDPTREELYHDEIDVRKRAKAELDRTIADAPAERDRVITAAKTELDRVIAEAKVQRDRVITAAKTEFEHVKAEAFAEQDRTVTEAKNEFGRAKDKAIEACKRVTG